MCHTAPVLTRGSGPGGGALQPGGGGCCSDMASPWVLTRWQSCQVAPGALMAPAKTPTPIVQKIARDIARVAEMPDLQAIEAAVRNLRD